MPRYPTQQPPRKLSRTTLRGRRDRTFLACHVLACLATLPPSPDVGELAIATGWNLEELSPVLDAMERAELVERWKDPDRPATVRVRLSPVALAQLGLKLAPTADRWNPDRPPSAPIEPGGSPQQSNHAEAVDIIRGVFDKRRT